MENLMYISEAEVRNCVYTIIGLSMQICIYIDPLNDEIVVNYGSDFYILKNSSVKTDSFGDIFNKIPGLQIQKEKFYIPGRFIDFDSFLNFYVKDFDFLVFNF
jgi:hypothetical protein